MPTNSNNLKTVLVLAPHPDDAEFYAGGTLAKWLSEGCRVFIAIATNGSVGSFSHPAEVLTILRRQESLHSALSMGAEPPIMLDHPDIGLDCLPPGHLREQFTRLIRQLQPDVLVAGDPFATGETHPDHRAAAWAASDAVAYAFLPLWHPEHMADGLQPHFVPEKYFYSDNNVMANIFVDISDYFEKKLAALAEHRSQMEFLVEDVTRQAILLDLDLGARLESLRRDPMQAVSQVLRSQAAEIGRIAGCQYAEAFRYTRFHPYIESFMERK